MKIPHTVPKIILRAYARELTEEQLKAQYEGRILRSEDPTWDVNIKETFAQLCLNLVIDDYPFFVRLTDETNIVEKKNHEAGFAKWQADLAVYTRRRASYDRKMLAEEFKKTRKARSAQNAENGVLDDQDDDDDDDSKDPGLIRQLIAPEAVPDIYPDYVPLAPVLDRLNDDDRMEVIEELDVKAVPLEIAINTIPDIYYWERAVLDRWPYGDKDEHGGDWKQTYMEMHYREAVENFHPFEGDLKELMANIDLVAPHVKEMTLINLIPKCFGVESRPRIFKPFVPDEELTGEDEGFAAAADLRKVAEAQKLVQEDEPEYVDDEQKPARDNSHLDLSLLMPQLKHLKKLCIIYEMQSMGMEWEARFFDFTDEDVRNLAKALSLVPTLEHLELNRSRMTSEQCKVFVKDGLMNIPRLRILNISYNNIGNPGALAIAKLLIESPSRGSLHTLSMARNNIKNKGAKALAYALTLNTHLTILDVRLNYIGNPGGKDFGHALVRNSTLKSLNLAANRLTEEACVILGKMLYHNTTLIELDVSSNNLGKAGGEHLAMGVRNNKLILKTDLRLTNSTLEFEYDVDTHLKKNRSKLPYTRLDRDDVYPPKQDSASFFNFPEEGSFDLALEDEDVEDEEDRSEITMLHPPTLNENESEPNLAVKSGILKSTMK